MRTSIQVPEIVRRLSDAEPLDELGLECHVELCENGGRVARLVLFPGGASVLTGPVQTHLQARFEFVNNDYRKP